ncbi:glucose uptake protein [Enterococcus thailandicus]|uniref:glucose uptake protein n=1 Tax=Enterococcus thailandicus TaxID=417368 RepID=UPI0022EBBE87|nr:glucose uptake protein [Enterococcus thailandicus]MDA3972414.1 glucose uptake protein [Enterococcus thailandicus]MDA3974910.1 glucose uptake protein [Enterococcus thailandicus]MDA3979874.1 glucose uptake protein [Enterococcus thailandicus]
MLILGQLFFYIPFFIMALITFYYIHWTRKKVSVLVASLPSAYFTYQIFTIRHWETTSLLAKYVFGLTISVILLIVWLFILYNKQN